MPASMRPAAASTRASVSWTRSSAVTWSATRAATIRRTIGMSAATSRGPRRSGRSPAGSRAGMAGTLRPAPSSRRVADPARRLSVRDLPAPMTPAGRRHDAPASAPDLLGGPHDELQLGRLVDPPLEVVLALQLRPLRRHQAEDDALARRHEAQRLEVAGAGVV